MFVPPSYIEKWKVFLLSRSSCSNIILAYDDRFSVFNTTVKTFVFELLLSNKDLKFA